MKIRSVDVVYDTTKDIVNIQKGVTIATDCCQRTDAKHKQYTYQGLPRSGFNNPAKTHVGNVMRMFQQHINKLTQPKPNKYAKLKKSRQVQQNKII